MLDLCYSDLIFFSLFFSLSPQQRNQNLSILSEVSRQPRGGEWLWHPKIVALYKQVLLNNDCSSISREAALGALQNITAGDSRVRPPPSMVR